MYMDLRTAVLSRLYILRLRPPQLHSITPINRKDNSMRAGIIMSEMFKSGSPARASECPELGVKQTSNSGRGRSAFSQKETLKICPNHGQQGYLSPAVLS